MASVVLTGDTSGSLTVSAPLVAGSNTQTLVATTGTLAPVVSGTAVTASGTSVDFTGIPSWVKRITVMFNGVSTNGTSNLLIQLGDSGGIENTGYISSANYTSLTATSTAGFILLWGINAAADTQQGCIILCNLSGNAWVSNGNMSDNAGRNSSSAGSKTLSDVLDRVRITTVNGTDAFDAGSINILYE
jgi:hypothetical protein